MKALKISVVIPFRNNTNQVKRCIDSIKSQSYRNIEIIVVSDSTKINDKTVISIVDPRLKGPGKKRNLGASKSGGDIIFFLDSDCIVKKDTIKKLLKVFKQSRADAVSGKPLAPKGGNILGISTGLEYEDRFNQMGEGFADVAAATCFGIRREAFKDIGGFKDYSKKEATGEDWDFSVKLRNENFRIFHTNKVEVIHDHGSETLSHWFKRRVEHAKYRVEHLKKYGKAIDQYSSWQMLISTTLLFSLPVVFRMYRKTKNPKLFALPFFALLRNIAWMIGILLGLAKS